MGILFGYSNSHELEVPMNFNSSIMEEVAYLGPPRQYKFLYATKRLLSSFSLLDPPSQTISDFAAPLISGLRKCFGIAAEITCTGLKQRFSESPKETGRAFDRSSEVGSLGGVIWKEDKLIEGVPETLDMLRPKGKRLVFVTNNSTKSRKQYGNKFESLGIIVSEEEIFSSSFAAAAYLQSINFPKDKKVKNLSSNNRLLETELEKTKNQLNEAKAVAVDEAEKSKAAKKVIKSLTSQDVEGALVANIGSYMGGVSVSRTWHLGTIQFWLNMLKRAAKESLGHAAAILTDVLENAV